MKQDVGQTISWTLSHNSSLSVWEEQPFLPRKGFNIVPD